MARNTNAAAVSTRRTAARIRKCVNARFLLMRRSVFICFLAEVGVGVVYSLPVSLQHTSGVMKRRSSLLLLHFCNAAMVPVADENDQERPLSTYRQS